MSCARFGGRQAAHSLPERAHPHQPGYYHQHKGSEQYRPERFRGCGEQQIQAQCYGSEAYVSPPCCLQLTFGRWFGSPPDPGTRAKLGSEIFAWDTDEGLLLISAGSPRTHQMQRPRIPRHTADSFVILDHANSMPAWWELSFVYPSICYKEIEFMFCFWGVCGFAQGVRNG